MVGLFAGLGNAHGAEVRKSVGFVFATVYHRYACVGMCSECHQALYNLDFD